ncbi:MAG: adenylate/guanylate cyclase domain-containing protein [Gaiellaceae bacterium]
MHSETRYAKSGGINIAYQVLGDGPIDLVAIPIWLSHLEAAWDEPSLARFYRRLASFSRLILFDKRGTGLSDRVPDAELPTLEERMDDVRAVMSAAGCERAALFGMYDGATMAALFAATYPERTSALATFSMFAKRMHAPDHPWGVTVERRQRLLDAIEQGWGGAVRIEDIAPSVAHDDRFRRWWAGYLRLAGSPGAALAMARMNSEIDIRSILPAIRVPTLVLHRTGDRRVEIGEARYIASMIPDARLVELPGEDHLPWVGDADAVLDEVEEFVTGGLGRFESDRRLATLVFTDIAGSTERAVALGDRRWGTLLGQHNVVARRQMERFGGRTIDSAGDGIFATFDGPARAIRGACATRDALQGLGLDVRAGVHTGEVEIMGANLGGIAVHIGSRVMSQAGAGEVLVSSTVKELVVGSGIAFDDRGPHELKGVPGEWRLFAVAET